MALETANFIDGLVATNPAATDPLAQADDHLRPIKAAIKASFPSISRAVTLTHTQINDLQNLQGVLSAPSGTRMLSSKPPPPPDGLRMPPTTTKPYALLTGRLPQARAAPKIFTAAFASHTPAGSVSTTISGNVDGTSLSVAQIPAHRHFIAANITGNALGALTASNSARRGGHQELASNNSEDYHLGGAGSTDATIGRTSSLKVAATLTRTALAA